MAIKRISRFDINSSLSAVSVLQSGRNVSVIITDRALNPVLIDGWVSYSVSGEEHPLKAGNVWVFTNWHNAPDDFGVISEIYVRTDSGLGYCFISQD